MVFPDLRFGSLYPQNLVLDPQKAGARVLSDAYKISPKLISFIYNFVFQSICDLRGNKYQYLDNS